MYLLGYDMGSSFIKVSLVDATTFQPVDTEKAPEEEMPMISEQAGWAEQDPSVWWTNAVDATKRLLARTGVAPSEIKSIGIGYQMHGLVLVDEFQHVLRPSIIWCDSRAVEIGHKVVEEFGGENFLTQTLNFPGNFTASKLKWVKENEPEIYAKIDKIMLPGDYLAMRLTGSIATTVSGLSEMILWDFQGSCISQRVLQAYGLDEKLIPDVLNTFESGGQVQLGAAQEMGLAEGIPVTYRAGDQPNNALSLGVLGAGEVAATGGTSGVIYGVMGEVAWDPNNLVNAFAHVTHEATNPAIGLLLCLNGAGRAYSWLRQTLGQGYEEMEKQA